MNDTFRKIRSHSYDYTLHKNKKMVLFNEKPNSSRSLTTQLTGNIRPEIVSVDVHF
jgi:hypothetical protein